MDTTKPAQQEDLRSLQIQQEVAEAMQHIAMQKEYNITGEIIRALKKPIPQRDQDPGP